MRVHGQVVDVDRLIELLASGRGFFDQGEAIDELTHALQTAGLALGAGADDALVVAAAFHDIGRLPALGRQHEPHEAAGAAFASAVFGPRVAWLISMHVPAKRYLVATDPRYTSELSDVAARSLQAQGGAMTADEIAAFEAHPWAQDAARLRRWDDQAKVPGAPAAALEDLRRPVQRMLSAA
jgi:predicted HD phosphohydrolase